MSQVEAQERALRTKTNDLVIKLAKADSLKTEYDEHAKRLERNRDTMADLVHRTDELVQVHKTVKAHVVSRINELTNTYRVIEDTDTEASSINATYSSLPKSAISLARTADKLNIHPAVTRIIARLKDVRIFSYPEYAELQKRLEDSESRLAMLVTENARLSRIIVALEIPNEDAFQKLEAECSMVLELQKKEHEEEMEQLKRECNQKVEDFCVLARDAKAAAFDRYKYHIRILEDNPGQVALASPPKAQSKDQFGIASTHAKVTGYDEEFDAYEVKMLLAESADTMNKSPPPHESMYYDETGELFARPDWKRATKLYFRRL
ncbi:hypothetical protein EC988_002280, partial [Linderina pennispora]